MSGKWTVTAFRWWGKVLAVALVLGGCGRQPATTAARHFPDGMMRAGDSLTVPLPPGVERCFLDIRYDDRYPYQNLWLRVRRRGLDTLLDVGLIRPDGQMYGQRIGPYVRMRLLMPPAITGPGGDTLRLVPFMRPDRVAGMWQWRVVASTVSAE